METVVLIFLAQGKLPEGRYKSLPPSLPRAEHATLHLALGDVTERKPGQPRGPRTQRGARVGLANTGSQSPRYSPFLRSSTHRTVLLMESRDASQMRQDAVTPPARH